MQHRWRALWWGPCTLTARPKDDNHLFQFHQPFLMNKETQTLGPSSLRVYWKLGSEWMNLTDQHSPAARGTEWIFPHFSVATYVSEHTGATRSTTLFVRDQEPISMSTVQGVLSLEEGGGDSRTICYRAPGWPWTNSSCDGCTALAFL